MKKIPSLLILLFLFACNASTEKEKEEEPNENAPVQQAISSLEPFADSLVRLNKYDIGNIEKSAYYFEKLVPADTVLADSASVLFLNFTLSAVDSVNQKLAQDTVDYFDLVYGGDKPPTAGQKAFQQKLKQEHITLQGDGEGGVFAALDYDWFTAIATRKTSAAVDTYLHLTGEEEKNPAMLDAAVAIELNDLVKRLLTTEFLSAQKLPTKFSDDVAGKNKFYTNALLFGSDNTPALEYEKNMVLTPEFKKAYDWLLATYPTTKAAQQIRDWLQIIKTKDKKKVEQMQQAQYE